MTVIELLNKIHLGDKANVIIHLADEIDSLVKFRNKSFVVGKMYNKEISDFDIYPDIIEITLQGNKEEL